MSTSCLVLEDLGELIPYLIYSINGLSIVGAIMVLITYILFPKLRENWFMRYLAYLNISNLFFGASSIFIYYNIFTEQSIPQTQVFTAIFLVHSIFRYSSFIWPLILAITLYQIILAKRSNNLSHYELFWLFIGFFIPIIIVLTLYCFGLIPFYEKIAVTIIEIIIPEMLMILFTFLAYVKFNNAAIFAFGDEEAKKIMKIILPYSFTTILILIPACAFNIINSLKRCMTPLSSVLLSLKLLQGTVDAIIYSFNPAVREEIRKAFRKNRIETIDLKEITMNSML